MSDLSGSATVRQYDPWAQEWTTVTVPAEPVQRVRTRTRRRRRPARAYVPASNASPIEPWWRDTGFYDMGPLADLRSWLPEPAIRTHRAAKPLPGDLGDSIAVGR